MSKEYIAKALKRLRDNIKLTADEVGAMIGKSGKTVNAWENGRGQPDAEMLIKLCDIYKVNNILAEFDDSNVIKRKAEVSTEEFKLLNRYRNLDYFGKKAIYELLAIEYSRCTVSSDEEEQLQPTIRIRCSTYKVSAGHGFELGNGDDWEEIEIPDSPETQKADFAIEIKGDSMEPVYFDGDIILVKDQDDIDEGEIGVFVLNGDGYIKKKGKRCLISLNEKYDDIEIREYDDFRCAGKVIGRV